MFHEAMGKLVFQEAVGKLVFQEAIGKLVFQEAIKVGAPGVNRSLCSRRQ